MPPSTVASLARALTSNLSDKRSDAAIQELDSQDKPVDRGYLRLQYFPDSISDSKSVNWSPKEIPGGSLPLYQWVSSGERHISFTTIFTTDVDFSLDARNNTRTLYDRLSTSKQDRNVDIRTAIYWLRSFTLPRYGSRTEVGTALTTAPRKFRLFMPNTGIGLAGGTSSVCGRDWMVCIMTGCEVSWEAFFPSGFPRIASVQLSLAQVAQYNGQVDFPSSAALDDLVSTGDATSDTSQQGHVFPYTLYPIANSSGIK